MDSKEFLELLPCSFFTGVPDSLLSAFSAAVIEKYGYGGRHVIAANEGNAVGLAAGHYLATGEPALVYLQNSGVGNIINPVTSLLDERVYGIPCLFLVGWRGEPGVSDEPQHAYMGLASRALLKAAGLETVILKKDASPAETKALIDGLKPILASGRSAAILVEKGALTGEPFRPEAGNRRLKREEAIGKILAHTGSDPVISTTGKASRELFELREKQNGGHGCDFLTVGSMGHCSSIAMGVALAKPQTLVWCIDGDGAAIMHLGALAVIGTEKPDNLVHIVINNGAHESVGGQPTAAGRIDLVAMARAAGYRFAAEALNAEDLDNLLDKVREAKKPAFLEVRCALGARKDLGRPTRSPKENKEEFMDTLRRKA